jgi:hypothetical protein
LPWGSSAVPWSNNCSRGADTKLVLFHTTGPKSRASAAVQANRLAILWLTTQTGPLPPPTHTHTPNTARFTASTAACRFHSHGTRLQRGRYHFAPTSHVSRQQYAICRWAFFRPPLGRVRKGRVVPSLSPTPSLRSATVAEACMSTWQVHCVRTCAPVRGAAAAQLRRSERLRRDRIAAYRTFVCLLVCGPF